MTYTGSARAGGREVSLQPCARQVRADTSTGFCRIWPLKLVRRSARLRR